MKIITAKKGYKGLLVIGDPHLEGRIPGFRQDDYPHVILEKLRWIMNYAISERLLPLFLGDIFHLPRNNPNWLLVAFMRLLVDEVFCIYGNHDVHTNELSDDDSLSVVIEAGGMRLLSNGEAVVVNVNGQKVVVGGTCWGQWIPETLNETLVGLKADLVVWLTHHDIIVPGYEEQGRIKAKELNGIDVVINGHVHRCLEMVEKGKTCWITPGNISRRNRSDATKAHRPSVLRIDVGEDGWQSKYIEIPHEPFDEVFYEAVVEKDSIMGQSAFVAGLAELEARQTETGEGLRVFLEKNLHEFENDVADEIRELAKEVIGDG